MIVTCRSCWRVEERPGVGAPAGAGDGAVVVRSPGGSRRAPVPERAALETLLASRRGEIGPVVAACPACGLPMVAEGPGFSRVHPAEPGSASGAPSPDGPVTRGGAAETADRQGSSAGGAGPLAMAGSTPWAMGWEIGPVRFEADGGVVGPDGPLSLEQAERLLDRALPQAPALESPGFGVFQGSLLVLMLAPLAVWVFSIVFVSVFLYRFPLPGPGGP